MFSLSLFRFSGSTKLVFVQTHKPNGYVTITDRNNNTVDVHNRYVTDLTDHPEQQEKAMSLYNYANLEGVQ